MWQVIKCYFFTNRVIMLLSVALIFSWKNKLNHKQRCDQSQRTCKFKCCVYTGITNLHQHYSLFAITTDEQWWQVARPYLYLVKKNKENTRTQTEQQQKFMCIESIDEKLITLITWRPVLSTALSASIKWTIVWHTTMHMTFCLHKNAANK